MMAGICHREFYRQGDQEVPRYIPCHFRMQGLWFAIVFALRMVSIEVWFERVHAGYVYCLSRVCYSFFLLDPGITVDVHRLDNTHLLPTLPLPLPVLLPRIHSAPSTPLITLIRGHPQAPGPRNAICARGNPPLYPVIRLLRCRSPGDVVGYPCGID